MVYHASLLDWDDATVTKLQLHHGQKTLVKAKESHMEGHKGLTMHKLIHNVVAMANGIVIKGSQTCIDW